MSHQNYKTKEISRVSIKPNSLPLRIIAIVLSILFITLYVQYNSKVPFFAQVHGEPAILPSNSLSINAYTSQGKAVGVLNTTKAASSTFSLNLQEGKYILLAVATWLPGSEDVTGYAIFSYMVNVVP
jgi:hypothetical protein